MDPSALQGVSKNLESSLDCWGRLLLVSTGVVVLGLLLEYWEPVQEFIAEWRKSGFPWKWFMGLAGGFLITVGVAGELAFTYKASRVENKLRENNHQIEQLLNKEAGDAQRSADGASKAASAASTSAQTANDQAGIAKQRAEEIGKKGR
jgi:hypothetical protein